MMREGLSHALVGLNRSPLSAAVVFDPSMNGTCGGDHDSCR